MGKVKKVKQNREDFKGLVWDFNQILILILNPDPLS